MLLAVAAGFGLGGTLMALAAPLYFQRVPKWVWRWSFWGGITLMALMSIDAALLLIGGDDVRPYLPNLLIYNGAIALAVALGLLIYQILIPWKGSVAKEPRTLSITSYGQSGGITAHTVNAPHDVGEGDGDNERSERPKEE